MKNLGYYNGEYGLLEEMKIPMNDRVCYFGDGVYDATYSRNHVIFALDEHIERFFNSAGLLRIKIPYSKEELKEILKDMVKKVDCGEQFVYWQVTRGTAMRNHAFPDTPANLWITLKPANIKDMSEKAKLITLEDTRFLHCNIKTLNLLPSVIAAQKTEEAGCQEAVFHRGDRVTECAHSNVSIIKDGIFKTAPADNLILPGIARAHIIKMCKKFEIPVNETAFTLKELMEADEVVVTSSGQFCITACEIDGKPVGGKAPEIIKNYKMHY
ncbi:D-alanine transaminase [Clostridium saccharobutylicum]|nr:D-alanine transaminase [Clostridium saccharobutylicum]